MHISEDKVAEQLTLKTKSSFSIYQLCGLSKLTSLSLGFHL